MFTAAAAAAAAAVKSTALTRHGIPQPVDHLGVHVQLPAGFLRFTAATMEEDADAQRPSGEALIQICSAPTGLTRCRNGEGDKLLPVARVLGEDDRGVHEADIY